MPLVEGLREVRIVERTSHDQVAKWVESALTTTPVADIHTHLYEPAFGELLLWGLDLEPHEVRLLRRIERAESIGGEQERGDEEHAHPGGLELAELVADLARAAEERTRMRYRVLIVDDEADSRDALAELTQRWGYDVQTASDGTEALRRAIEGHPDVILTDLVMPNMDGLWLLRALRAELPECPVVLLTGRGTIQTAVQAIKEGAYDFIEKPLEVPRLRIVLERALEKKETMREVQLLKRRLAALAPGTDMIGSGPAMQRVFDLVKKVSPSHASVVITGESGTGKEIVARAVHNLSPRKEKPFVALNCSAIPATLIESELFGYERGAFTGAEQRRLGNFELAHEGTLFLDEIGDLPLELQAKFLRVIEDRRFRRLGGRAEVELDVRVICATHRDLKEEIRQGRFREDLYFRLNVVPVHVPPLRERREDIAMLVRHFTQKAIDEQKLPPRSFSGPAIDRLVHMDWPGNVRELRNTVERLLILARGPEVVPAEVERLSAPGQPVPSAPTDILAAPTFAEFKDRAERAYILAKLREHDWNVSETARAVDMPRSNLYKKIERFGLLREE